MIYLTTIFTLIFIFYTKWQFSDDRGETQGKWHPYGLLMRLSVFIIAYLCQLYPSDWQDYILAGVINMIGWDVELNIIALKKEWNYEGSTSIIDLKLKKTKWIIYAVLLIAAITIKIIL